MNLTKHNSVKDTVNSDLKEGVRFLTFFPPRNVYMQSVKFIALLIDLTHKQF